MANSLFSTIITTATILVILVVHGVRSQPKSGTYLKFNEECSSFQALDAQVIQIVSRQRHAKTKNKDNYLCPLNSKRSHECFSASALEPELWDSELMEDYMNEMMHMTGLCDPNALLSCVNLLDTESGFESADTRVVKSKVIYYNVLNISDELMLTRHWVCRCNPDTAVESTNKTKKDKCDARVGTPCKYRPILTDTLVDESLLHGNHYDCRPGSVCVPIPGLQNHTVAQSIQALIGYPFTMNGVRQATINYTLTHATHVCRCNTSFIENGKGECIHYKQYEATAAAELPQSPFQVILSIFVLILVSAICSQPAIDWH